MVRIHRTAGEALLSAEVHRTEAVIVAGKIVTTTQEGLDRLRNRGMECRYILPTGPFLKEPIQLRSMPGVPRARRLA
jgi:hypothetical protein